MTNSRLKIRVREPESAEDKAYRRGLEKGKTENRILDSLDRLDQQPMLVRYPSYKHPSAEVGFHFDFEIERDYRMQRTLLICSIHRYESGRPEVKYGIEYILPDHMRENSMLLQQEVLFHHARSLLRKVYTVADARLFLGSLYDFLQRNMSAARNTSSTTVLSPVATIPRDEFISKVLEDTR